MDKERKKDIECAISRLYQEWNVRIQRCVHIITQTWNQSQIFA